MAYNTAPLLWTAGRVVEGARLERVYRVTYLGFEPLAVRHILIEFLHTDSLKINYPA